jgi:hypothetical protein
MDLLKCLFSARKVSSAILKNPDGLYFGFGFTFRLLLPA